MSKKFWYQIKPRAVKDGEAEVADVSIDDEIGGWGISAKQFLAEFRAIKANTVNLFINSPGGDVIAGIAMFNGMLATGKTINVTVQGIAASMGSYLAMIGQKVTMPSNTFMWVHNPVTVRYGNAEEFRAVADELDRVGASLMKPFEARFKGEADLLAKLFADETLLTAEECLAYGFCDEVIDPIELSASFDPESAPEPVRRVFEAARKPAPAPAPEPAPVVSAAAIRAAAEKAGLGDFVAVLVFAEDITSANLEAKIAEAAEIVALCGIAKREAPEIEDMLRARTPLAEARKAIAAAMQSAPGNRPINNAPPINSGASLTASFNPTDVWADIHAAQAGGSK